MTLAPSDLSEVLEPERLVDRLRSLVRIPSENPPGDEAEVGALIRSSCEELHLEVEEHPAKPGRPNIVARWRGGDGPTVGFCSHLDVVPAGDPALWPTPPYEAAIVDGRLRGRGASDAKGPIAAVLEAVAILQATEFAPAGTLELALVSDEESGGFKGAGYLVAERLIAPDMAIVGEPTSMRVVRAQRGIAWSRITTKGEAAHGSAPERGTNAIAHMAAIVTELDASLPDVAHPVVGRPTIGVGTIRGGDKLNMVPASCVIEIDRRTIPGESEADVRAQFEAAIERARRVHPGIDARIEILGWGRPFAAAPDSPLVATMAAAARDVTGSETDLIGFRGASDARFLAEAGTDVIVFGPGDIELAHTVRESIDLGQLEHGALAYALAFARLLGAT